MDGVIDNPDQRISADVRKSLDQLCYCFGFSVCKCESGSFIIGYPDHSLMGVRIKGIILLKHNFVKNIFFASNWCFGLICIRNTAC